MSVNETDEDILISTDTERADLSSPVGNSCPSILINHLLVSAFHSCLLPSPNNFNTALLGTVLKDIPFHPSFSFYWLLLILIYPHSYSRFNSGTISSKNPTLIWLYLFSLLPHTPCISLFYWLYYYYYYFLMLYIFLHFSEFLL